ncbi:hypothetical protein B0H10DRAFT_13553 [Mycena sp. CBHHK59/15]|nr:hypothetical protein B0H10DRAFT_13553 [Mycena sp. CBHHK59/15]
MRAPAGLFDQNVLEDEPLRSIFAACALAGIKFRRLTAEVAANTAREIAAVKGGDEAVAVWLRFANAEDSGAAQLRVAIQIQTATPKTREFFVQVFWALHQGGEKAALVVLNNHRRDNALEPLQNSVRHASLPTRTNNNCRRKKLESITAPSVPQASGSVSRPRLFIRLPARASLLGGRSNLRTSSNQNQTQSSNDTPPFASTSTQPLGFNALQVDVGMPLARRDPNVASSSGKTLPFKQEYDLSLFQQILAAPWRRVPVSQGSLHEILIESTGTSTSDDDTWASNTLMGFDGELEMKTPHQAFSTSVLPPRSPEYKHLPPIWAQTRQEVCETFPLFRRYQGGVYHKNDEVSGYLLGAFASQRDCFEHGGKFIISHGGGKGEKHSPDKKIIANAGDHKQDDRSIRALLNNYRTGRPVVLLVDDKYVLFPVNLTGRGVHIAVLGFYRVIYAWAEHQDVKGASLVRYKFAFQWCEGQGQPWWWCTQQDPAVTNMPSTRVAPTLAITFPPTPSFPCPICTRHAPLVYLQWACLNPECGKFWKTLSDEPLPHHLQYNPSFLQLVPSFPLPAEFKNALQPKQPPTTFTHPNTAAYEYTGGWHCRLCGRLSCRSSWEKHECKHCHDIRAITTMVLTAAVLKESAPASHRIHGVAKDSGITARILLKFISPCLYPDIVALESVEYTPAHGPGTIQTFELPHVRGKIHLIQGGEQGNAEADAIFQRYQTQAADGTLLLRRWPLKRHRGQGELLSNYFSQNTGEVYKYVGGSEQTVPFDRAPQAVIDARKFIEARIQAALKQKHSFNEVLTAAYLKDQKMAVNQTSFLLQPTDGRSAQFHSDDEKGLGPVVASLSLGSSAVMRFRPTEPPEGKAHGSQVLSMLLKHVGRISVRWLWIPS